MKKRYSFLLAIACVGISLVPLWNLIYFLSSVGVDNPSNDSVLLVKILDEMLSGSYAWKNLFYDTFLNSHPHVFSTLTQALLAYFFEWRILHVLYFGVFLSVLKLALLFDAFTCLLQGKLKWLLLPMLSFLVFSPSQISTFEFEYIAVTKGLHHLGFCLGLWGLVRFRTRWLGFGLMLAGGLLAGGSFGGGILVWPIFLLGMYGLGFRRRSQWISTLGVFLLNATPYLYFLILYPKPNPFKVLEAVQPTLSFSIASLFNPSFLLQGIGLVFSQNLDLATALWRGGIGVALLAGVLVVFLAGFKAKRRLPLLPSLLALLYGVGVLYLISVVRQSMAPWYTSPGMFFWIGAVGATAAILDSFKLRETCKKIFENADLFQLPVACIFFLATTCYFYTSSNSTFEDKSFYLRTRAPVSASCLRHYQNAPESCYSQVFLWPNGSLEQVRELGAFLEKHGLSIFSKRREWSLQGDFSFDGVKKIEQANVPRIFWSADLSSKEAPVEGFHRLNLFLHTPNAVEWTVELPANLQSAEFKSAIAISTSAPHAPDTDGVLFEIYALEEGVKKTLLFAQFRDTDQRTWSPVEFSLKKFAGKKVTLQLTSQPVGNINHDWAMYRYPRIRLVLD